MLTMVAGLFLVFFAWAFLAWAKYMLIHQDELDIRLDKFTRR